MVDASLVRDCALQGERQRKINEVYGRGYEKAHPDTHDVRKE